MPCRFDSGSWQFFLGFRKPMFSDTHFHFSMIKDRLQNSARSVVSEMVKRDCFFALDIGTKSGDVSLRYAEIKKTLSELSERERIKAEKFFFQSAGIWPSKDEIQNRINGMETLERSIEKSEKNICAIGECGCDHHWNPSGADGRCEGDFTNEVRAGEKELFEMQLLLAKKMNLPVIVHSRDAFSDTFSCIKNAGYDTGIIHCFSYGIEEAKKFLERGWFLSFSGSVTYTKKGKLADMKKLLSFVPETQILCETDSPYLSPVPHRGETNTPNNVPFVYEFVAALRGVRAEALSETVDENCKRLFRL